MALQLSTPPLVVATDYQGLIDGIASGSEACTAANRLHADIWRLIWAAVSDFGLSHITLQKVRAHVALARIQDGSVDCTWQDWFGNKIADLQAKQGAACHPSVPLMEDMVRNSRAVVTSIARWLGILGAHLLSMTSPDMQSRDTMLSQGLELIEIPEHPDANQWTPRVLHCEAKNVVRSIAAPELQQQVAVSASQPKPRIVQRAHPSHDLNVAGSCVFCWSCGGHSSGRQSAVLSEGCRGEVTSTACKRLRSGLHPGSGLHLGPVRRWPGPAVFGESCSLEPASGSDEQAAGVGLWDPRLALGLPRFWEDQGAQVIAALPVGPPSASLVGTGSTFRRRFRFAQSVDDEVDRSEPL